MITEAQVDRWFEAFNAARISLSTCTNMVYNKQVPFSDKTAEEVSDILGQLDQVFHRLNEEAGEWDSERSMVETIKRSWEVS